jgi:hypothetical protein
VETSSGIRPWFGHIARRDKAAGADSGEQVASPGAPRVEGGMNAPNVARLEDRKKPLTPRHQEPD